jgi:hypothetical protein
LETREKRLRSTPARLRHDNAVGHDEFVSEAQQLKAAYFEAMDIELNELPQRFNQDDLSIAVAREEFLLRNK